MNSFLIVKIFCILLVSVTFAAILSIRKSQSSNPKHSRYLPDISGLLLPACLIALFAPVYFTNGRTAAHHFILSLCFTVFLHISLYYLFLIPLLPYLRKRISARACYLLWLIPNYLYFAHHSFMRVEKPLFVIRAPGTTVWIVLSIWFAGFITVLGYKIISHLLFRRYILKDAKEIRNLTIIRCWGKELEYSRVKYLDYKLVRSQKVTTPLSIGLFKKAICVVLPDINYTEEELALIFRHELVHISREDSWTKFFLIFCTAVCWFNPLMWFAMKKSAEDMELACDELVLHEADQENRIKYASLILQTAGDERGFTTCLSASAKTLRYRLNKIMVPGKSYTGAVTIGIVSFLLFMSCGYISLAYGTYTGNDVIFRNKNPETYSVYEVYDIAPDTHIQYNCMDSVALLEYLNNLTFSRSTGNYNYTGNDKNYYIALEGSDGIIEWLELTNDRIQITSRIPDDRVSSNYQTVNYYLSEPTDWNYLNSILMEYQALNVTLHESPTSFETDITTYE